LASLASVLAWTDGIVVEGTEFGGGVKHDGKILVTKLPPRGLRARRREVDRDEASSGSNRASTLD